MSVIALGELGNYEERYFPYLIKNRSQQRIFASVKETDELRYLKEVDLTKVIWWDPKLIAGEMHGVWQFQRRLKAQSVGKIPLGLTFAEAMIDKPWPEEWRNIQRVGCAGTVFEFTRGYRPKYVQLERNRYEWTKVAMTWRLVESKIPLSLRVPFYPTET